MWDLMDVRTFSCSWNHCSTNLCSNITEMIDNPGMKIISSVDLKKWIGKDNTCALSLAMP